MKIDIFNSVSVNRHRLVIEGFECKELDSLEHDYNFMLDLTEKLNMKLLFPPVLVKIPVVNPTPNIDTVDYGNSGYMLWLESGCSLHSWPKQNFVALDIFSCKIFSVENALDTFRKWYRPEATQILKPIIREQMMHY